MARAASWSSRSAGAVRSPRAAADAPERQVDAALDRHRTARDHGPVGLLDVAAAERGRELGGGARGCGPAPARRRCRGRADARGGAGRTAEAQRVEHGVEMAGDARAALHRQAVRLVQHQQMIVPVEHQALQVPPLRPASSSSVWRLGRARARPAAAARAPPGRRRAGSRSRRACRRRAPGRCGKFLDGALGQARKVPAEPAVEPDVGLVLARPCGSATLNGSRSARSFAQCAMPLGDLALEAAVARPVEGCACHARRESSSGRRTLRPSAWS